MRYNHKLTALLLSTLLSTRALAEESCTSIQMGFNPDQNAALVSVGATALGKYLEKNMQGVAVKVSVAKDYAALVEGMGKGQVDFGWFSPVSYVDASQNAGAQVLLKSVRGSKPVYWSALVVRSASNIKKLEELRGKTIAWIDPKSAAGYAYPKALLLSKGIDPDTFFAKQIFAGDHGSAVLALLNGEVDVVATFADNTQGSSGSWTQLLRPEQAALVTPLLYSKPISGDPLAVRKAFAEACPEVAQKMTKAILGMRYFAESKNLLKTLYRIEYMVPALDSDYDVVREVQRLVYPK
jgi:phosphonate transport system substrate-binding protein